MKVINGSRNFKGPYRYAVATFGNFDGVHKGHQKIIKKVVKNARKNRGTAVLYTFDPHPVKVLAPELTPPLLQTQGQKKALLESLGLDIMIIEPFTKSFSENSAQKFFQEIIVERIRTKEIIIGYDFTFGLQRSANVEDLQKMADAEGIKVDIVNPIFHKNSLISSTHIRHFVEIGNLNATKTMLGRPYSIEGKVIKGRGVGAEIGFHTANLKSQNEIIPPPGVYITRTKKQKTKKAYMSLTNIGYNPTFKGTVLSIETYLLDFSGSLLGQKLEIEFLKKIRREMTFESPEELRSQIIKDIEKARKYYEKRI